jgi:uncharacterized sodium:solute symporter family permease YidK
VCLILVDEIPFFKKHFQGVIPEFFEHQYSREMREKSEVVSIIEHIVLLLYSICNITAYYFTSLTAIRFYILSIHKPS